MRRTLPLLSLVILLLLLGACKATKKAYERGDYEQAVFNSIERLSKSPNHKKARQTLAQAYPDMVDFYQDRINSLKTGGDPLKWEQAVDYYSILDRAYTEIQRIPAARNTISRPVNVQTELNDAKFKAAEVRYALGTQGIEAGKKGDREAAKQAYNHFQQAMKFKPGYRDAEQKMLEAQDLATIYVQIQPIPMHSRTLALSNEFFENQLTEYIRNAPFSPFVRFFSAREAEARKREPDQVILMIFDEFVVGQAYVKETVYNRVRDSVVVGEVEIAKDSVVDVYGTVKAEMHQFQKEISSGGLLDFRIIDTRTEAILSQRKFPGTYIWYDRWGYYNGDERALANEDKEFMRRRRESPNPPPQDLFIEFTKPIFNQVTGFVSDYYRNY
ncbi:MAG: hypothetical protein SF052_01110 [Bacteroidia bacterium]|nr:hypothetical protein [Bacteroidia bacterium]